MENKIMLDRHHLKNKHCSCGKSITDYAIRCQSCNIKNLFKIGKIKNNGKNNGAYKVGKYLEENMPTCKICKKKLSNPEAEYCATHSRQVHANDPSRILKIRTTKCKHHIFGKKYPETLILSRKLHAQLHNNVYFYILERYGKQAILDYIKWFKNKFINKTR
jgi:hypothetical protein